jgi:hypothetical protein
MSKPQAFQGKSMAPQTMKFVSFLWVTFAFLVLILIHISK